MVDSVRLGRGVEIMERVRSFFAEGHKSGNKKYDEKLQDTEKFKKREQHRLAGTVANVGWDSRSAKQLLAIKNTDRSGNCAAMAVLSAHYAIEDHHVPRDKLMIGLIASPGDHVFCLEVDELPGKHDRDFDNLAALAKHPSAANWLVIDPWLRVACGLDEYIAKSRDKLEKWNAAGKRIDWYHPSYGRGWYPPTGAYAEAFAKKGNIALYEFKE